MSEKMNVYTGVTIGPILDTMALTSKPAGLWAASYLFSHITCELLTELCKNGIPADAFVVPAFSWDGSKVVLEGNGTERIQPEQTRSRGVGLFHDRVILKGKRLTEVQNAVDAVAGALAQKLNAKQPDAKQPDWFRRYLRIYALAKEVPEDKNPILVLGPLLDALELEPQYVPMGVDNDNPLLKSLLTSLL